MPPATRPPQQVDRGKRYGDDPIPRGSARRLPRLTLTHEGNVSEPKQIDTYVRPITDMKQDRADLMVRVSEHSSVSAEYAAIFKLLPQGQDYEFSYQSKRKPPLPPKRVK